MAGDAPMPEASPHPPAVRRPLVFDSLDEVIADIDRLQDGGYARAGKWSLPEMCDHFTRFAEFSLDGFPRSMPRWLQSLLGRRIFRAVLRRGRMPAGMPAPKVLLRRGAEAASPLDGPAGDEAVERCKAALRRVRDHRGEFALHPFAGRITPEEWRRVQLIHCAHHLSFLIPRRP